MPSDHSSQVGDAQYSADQEGGLPFRITRGCGPVLAVALHAGHFLRPGLADYVVVPEDDRLREEDPFTAAMVPEGVTTLEIVRSRFEVDLNRSRERALYDGPDDAWGLNLYSRPLPREIQNESQAVYDNFYDYARKLLSEIERTYGRFVVLDLHSYNHRREGPRAVQAPAESNPEINVGTERFDRDRWSPVVERFMRCMNEAGFDCRENVKFRGGHFSQWVSDNFPDTGVALAVEFKKTYMDEWTGCPDMAAIERIRRALRVAIDSIEEVLPTMTRKV